MDRPTTIRTLETLARVARERRQDLNAQPLPDFVSRCLDCGYELAALEDGRCPECGLGFSHSHLREVELDRRKRAAHILSQFRHAPLAVGMAPFVLSAAAEGYLGFFLQLASLLLAGAAWCYFNRTYLSYQSHALLVLLPPLAWMFFLIASEPNGLYGMIACVALAAGVGYLSLRSSPLVSSLVLGGAVIVPMVISGVVLVMENQRLKRAGTWWGTLDIPAVPRWRAVNPQMAIQAGAWLLALACIFAIAIAFVARRAVRRLRNHARSRGRLPDAPTLP